MVWFGLGRDSLFFATRELIRSKPTVKTDYKWLHTSILKLGLKPTDSEKASYQMEVLYKFNQVPT